MVTIQIKILKAMFDSGSATKCKDMIRATGLQYIQIRDGLKGLYNRGLINRKSIKVPYHKGGMLNGETTYELNPRVMDRIKKLINLNYGPKKINRCKNCGYEI